MYASQWICIVRNSHDKAAEPHIGFYIFIYTMYFIYALICHPKQKKKHVKVKTRKTIIFIASFTTSIHTFLLRKIPNIS